MNAGTQRRVLTAAILIPVVVAAIWWGPTALVAALASMIAVLALLEFFAMGEALGFRAYRLWTCLAAVGIFAQQWYVTQSPSIRSLDSGSYLLLSPHGTVEVVLLIFLLGVVTIVLTGKRPLADVFASGSISAAGLVVIVLPLSAVVRLHGVQVIGPKLLLFVLVVVWVGDTAAYFAGRGFGSRKMSPQVSPGKTWVGAAANLFGALLVAIVFSYWLQLSLVDMFAMAFLGSVAGQASDLFESALKRSANVKDSGTILPGHGGILDRIDALILAAPVVWYYFEWFAMRRN